MAFLLALGTCNKTPKSQVESSAVIATTNSYLECVAKDLLGRDTPVLALAGPGMCPGHFDIRPSQISALHRCRILLRFDFQKTLEDKLTELEHEGLRNVSIRIEEGMCVPDSYMSACRQVSDALIASDIIDEVSVNTRLSAIENRLAELKDWSKQQIDRAGLIDLPVLTSKRQAKFCKCLGLNVVGTFSSSDAAGAGEITAAIEAGEKAGVKTIVANLPEGRQLADRLAERLNATVIVFDNFPDASQGQVAFDDLFRGNLSRLITKVER